MMKNPLFIIRYLGKHLLFSKQDVAVVQQLRGAVPCRGIMGRAKSPIQVQCR